MREESLSSLRSRATYEELFNLNKVFFSLELEHLGPDDLGDVGDLDNGVFDDLVVVDLVHVLLGGDMDLFE